MLSSKPLFGLLLVLTFGQGCKIPAPGSREAGPVRFDVALIGDVPYSPRDTTNSFPNMIEEINGSGVSFVVHDGDIKSSEEPCRDELFIERYQQFQTFSSPLIYLFGDNEWTDCGRNKTNAFDPEERLMKLREIFTEGNGSLGRRQLALERQSNDPQFVKFRENVRWSLGNVLFVGLNVPGDANNFGHREYAGRNVANLAWLNESFAQAARDQRRGLMLILQANPHFELSQTNRLRLGFNDLLRALERHTLAFAKPVVLVHGDSHYFRIDKPLIHSATKRRIENFTRVETFGNPDVHWVRATIDDQDPNVFSFRQQIVTRNIVHPEPRPQSASSRQRPWLGDASQGDGSSATFGKAGSLQP